MIVVFFIAVYFVAAIPSGYWMGLLYGKDLTQIGSKSTGATNVLREIGKWQALLVLTIDIVKGFLPVFYAEYYLGIDSWLLLSVTLIPIIAHSKSIYIKFKGGKSSATGFGVLLAINPFVALITIATWITTVAVSRYSSLGSIICIPLVPVWLYLFGEDLPMIMFGVMAFVYIVLIKHRTNIRRLLAGKEPKIKFNS